MKLILSLLLVTVTQASQTPKPIELKFSCSQVIAAYGPSVGGNENAEYTCVDPDTFRPSRSGPLMFKVSQKTTNKEFLMRAFRFRSTTKFWELEKDACSGAFAFDLNTNNDNTLADHLVKAGERRIMQNHWSVIVEDDKGEDLGSWLLNNFKGDFPAEIPKEEQFKIKLEYNKVLLKVYIDVAKSLKKFHDLGLVYRDIRLENVLNQNGVWKLIDLGLAVKEEGDVWMVIGDEYADPVLMLRGKNRDQVFKRTAKKSSDMYSLGMMFYLLLTKRPPYENMAGQSSYQYILARGRHYIRFGDHIPVFFIKMLERLLTIDSEYRWTIDQLLTSLEGNPDLAKKPEGREGSFQPWNQDKPDWWESDKRGLLLARSEQKVLI